MVWRKNYSPPGAVPGTLHPAPDAPSDVRITAMHYTPEHATERQVTELEAFLADMPSEGVLWLNVDGLGDTAIVQRLGEHFGLHPLCLEDVLNVPQRPKLEDYDSYAFLVLRMPMRQEITGLPEQVTLFLGASYVLTFQERQGDVFEPVRDRIRHSRGHIRRRGADYLAYALLDAAIDGFFPMLEQLGEGLEALEDAVFSQPGRETLEALLKRQNESNNFKCKCSKKPGNVFKRYGTKAAHKNNPVKTTSWTTMTILKAKAVQKGCSLAPTRRT